jgi:hypothetical protein
VSDENGIVQIEVVHEPRQVVGIRVHVVAVPRLARTAVAAAVVRDAPIPARSEKVHLIFERVGRQGPSMAKDHGPPGFDAPILIVDLASVFR